MQPLTTAMTRVPPNPDDRQTDRAEVTLTFSCRVCGRPVQLVPGEPGVVVLDRAAFLEMHESCLVANGND